MVFVKLFYDAAFGRNKQNLLRIRYLGQRIVDRFFSRNQIQAAEFRHPVFKQGELFFVLMDFNSAITGFTIISEFPLRRSK